MLRSRIRFEPNDQLVLCTRETATSSGGRRDRPSAQRGCRVVLIGWTARGINDGFFDWQYWNAEGLSLPMCLAFNMQERRRQHNSDCEEIMRRAGF